MSWITDFTAFQSELTKYEGQTVNLASSLSLVLDDFYSIIKHQPVSAMSGEGVRKLVSLVDESVGDYHMNFKANYDKMLQARQKKRKTVSTGHKKKPKASSDAYAFSEPGTDSAAVGFTLTLDSSDEVESEEEDPRDLELADDRPLPGQETIRDVYLKEADRKNKKVSQTDKTNES